MKKKILLTGGSGFIGKNIVEQLGSKYHILAPTHSELDLTDSAATLSYFKFHRTIDLVIHAAVVGGSRTEEHEKDSLKNNLRIFFNIIRNRKQVKKIICFGSGAEYDKTRSIKNVKEKDFDKRVPQDDYGFFKYLCSKYIERMDDIISLRIFGMFGKYEDYQYRFISNAICLNLLGRPITVNQNVFFDYVYIDDFIKIIEYFIHHTVKHKFYNIGTGKKIDLLSITQKINDIATHKSQIIVKNPGLNNEYTCNNAQLMKELGRFRFAPFDVSLHALYNWYRQNISTIKLTR